MDAEKISRYTADVNMFFLTTQGQELLTSYRQTWNTFYTYAKHQDEVWTSMLELLWEWKIAAFELLWGHPYVFDAPETPEKMFAVQQIMHELKWH